MNTSIYVKNASKNLENQNLKKAVEKISTALKSKESADAIIAFNAYAIQKNELFKLDGYKDFSTFCKSVFGWNKSTACNYAKIGRLFTEKTVSKSGIESAKWVIDGFNKTAWIQFSRLFDSELDNSIRLKSVDELKTFITEKTLFSVPVDVIKKAIDKYINPVDDSENKDSENPVDDSENPDSENKDSENPVDAFKTAFDAIMDTVKYLSEHVIPVDSENQKLLVSIAENLNIMVETR